MADDAELLAAARVGVAGALEALVERYQEPVYRFGLRMCGNPHDAEEIAQETLLAMARGVGDFRGDAAVTTWLYTIARSFCGKQRRRRKDAPAVTESLETAAVAVDPGARPDEAAARQQLGAALERAIGALDPMYREVLVLRDAEGLTAPEVAAVLGIGVDAVKSRLHRARLSVRKELAPLLHAPEEVDPACPDVLSALSQEVEGELSRERCAELERHVEGCARCRGRCDSLKQTLALCRTAPTAPVPAAVQAAVRTAIRAFIAAR